MFLTAVHEVHIGAEGVRVAPGQVYDFPESVLADLHRLGAVREPTEVELKLAGVAPALPLAPAPAAKKAKPAAEPDLA